MLPYQAAQLKRELLETSEVSGISIGMETRIDLLTDSN